MVLDFYTTGFKFPRRVPRKPFGRRPGRNADSATPKRPGAGLAGCSGLAPELLKFRSEDLLPAPPLRLARHIIF